MEKGKPGSPVHAQILKRESFNLHSTLDGTICRVPCTAFQMPKASWNQAVSSPKIVSPLQHEIQLI